VSQKIQQNEHVICHDTIMRSAHDKIMAEMFQDMRCVHGWSEKTLLVGMQKQA
jgi:hypothetical protein